MRSISFDDWFEYGLTCPSCREIITKSDSTSGRCSCNTCLVKGWTYLYVLGLNSFVEFTCYLDSKHKTISLVKPQIRTTKEKVDKARRGEEYYRNLIDSTLTNLAIRDEGESVNLLISISDSQKKIDTAYGLVTDTSAFF